MRAYESAATIEAPPHAVWAVLTDAPGIASWDSGVVRIDGAIAPGQRIGIVSEASPKRAFPATVTVFEAPRRMVWSGGMPLGLFRGVRTFALEPRGTGTAFRMREEFSGPLLPLIWKSMPDLQPSFDRFAAGLKARVEAGALASGGPA